MTRINAGIHQVNLVDQHCFAEWRELPRVASTIVSGTAVIKNIPQHFTLNTGHVKFFYDKQLYLYNRYKELTRELINRKYNFNIEIYERNLQNFEIIQQNYPQLWNDFDDRVAKSILVDRISIRLSGMKNLKYYKNDISIADAIKML